MGVRRKTNGRPHHHVKEFEVSRNDKVLWLLKLDEARKRYRIVVADDEAGLPEGVTWPVPGKIGTLIVQTLRENAKTDLNVESAPDKGVRVTISFDHKAPTRQTN